MIDSDPTEPRVVELAAQPTVAVRVQQQMAELDLGALFGPYETLSQTYDRLREWLREHGRAEGAPWESYVDDPTEVDDVSRLRTEVYWPLG